MDSGEGVSSPAAFRGSSGHGCRGEGESGEGPQRAPDGLLHADNGGIAARIVGAGARSRRGRDGVAGAGVEIHVREVLQREGPPGEIRLQELADGYTSCFHRPISCDHMYSFAVPSSLHRFISFSVVIFPFFPFFYVLFCPVFVG